MHKPEKSAGAVVYREENGGRHYLILHYSEGHWDLPKGHVEKGESEKETARREIFEETGIKELEFAPDFRAVISYSFQRRGSPIPKDVVFFIAKTSEKKVRLSDEHTGYEWLPYPQAEKKVTYEKAKGVLAEAEKLLSSP